MTYYSYNNVDATNKSLWFNFKSRMKAAGWTVPSSSDALTYNASGDQITVNAVSGAGGMGTSSWFTLAHPTLDGYQRFINIQVNATGQARVKLSWTGFSGGSPGTVRVPSAVDEVVLLGAGTDASPTYASFFNATDGLTNVFIMAGDVTEKYHFHMFGILTGTMANQCLFTMERLSETHALDIDPYLYYIAGGGLSGFDTSTACVWTSSGSTQPFSWYKKGLAGATFARYSTGMLGANGSTQTAVASIGTNAYDKKADVIPMCFARGAGWTTQLGWKGIATNTFFSGLPRVTGLVVSINTTNDYIYFGPYTLLRWDGSNPKL